MKTKSITLRINGMEYQVLVKDNETLLDVLREKLHLTGTKRGCDIGACGACTVIINGKSINSCLLLAVDAEGKDIMTIEGISKNEELHPLQKAFVNIGAIQCGYCTPGMIMSGKALIDKNPNPSEEEIKDALSGNLCRCTGYKRIIESIKNWKYFDEKGEVRHNFKEFDKQDLDKFAVVGRSLPRVDGVAKVSGQLKYVGDIYLPNMLYGKILGSRVAHGIIKSIDTSEAEKLPGVKAIITGKDVPDIKYGVSPARYDEHVLAKDKVRYVGDEVAAVAAIDEETAEKAIKLIKVEYEELPAVFNPFDAMKEGAPLLHENYPNNINTRIEHHFGDIEKGFAEADYIREETFIGNHTTHCPMEPHAAISYWDEENNLIVYTSTQSSHYIQYQLSRVLQIPMSKIRIISPTAGGGFGGKAEATPLEFCSAILSKKCGQPVKMVYTRKEVFQHHRGRHKQYIKLKIGVKRDGTITAVKNETYLDGGAYTGYGITTAYYSGSMIPTLYKIPNYKYDGYRVYTNKPACGAQRGNGVPQPRFAFESLLTMIAEDLGIDPIEIRLRNAMTPNTRTINDLDIKSCEFKATLLKAKELSGWEEKYKKLPKGKGIGVGSGGFVSGAGYPIYRSKFPHSNAMIKVSEDGLVAICFINAKEIGQGSSTVLSQICAEGLGLPLERVKIRTEDSDICPLDLGSYSSRVTLMAGNAVLRAAKDVLSKILPYAAKILNCDENQLEAKLGKIFIKGNEEKFIDWSEAAKKYFSERGPLTGTGSYSPPEGLGGTYKGAAVGTSPAYSFGTTICEVSVDLETGKVKIDSFYDAHDCGTPINPMLAHGQVEGSAVMGASETIMENIVFNEKGEIVNANLNDYLIMTIKDAPEIYGEFVESYEPEGPFGAKEIGEGSTVPVLAAVAAAIANATGVWIKELPITPEKIFKALTNAKKS